MTALPYRLGADGVSIANARLCADWSAGAYLRQNCNVFSKGTGAAAWVFDAGPVIVAAFQGSCSPLDFVQDARFLKRDGIHSGFLGDIEALMPALTSTIAAMPGKPLVLTGHSLGGALATLFAHFRSDWSACITFGGPRVFDSELSHDFDLFRRQKTFRFVHANDLVARLPWLGYRHVGHHIMLWDDGSWQLDPPLETTLAADLRGLWHGFLGHHEVLIRDHFMGNDPPPWNAPSYRAALALAQEQV